MSEGSSYVWMFHLVQLAFKYSVKMQRTGAFLLATRQAFLKLSRSTSYAATAAVSNDDANCAPHKTNAYGEA